MSIIQIDDIPFSEKLFKGVLPIDSRVNQEKRILIEFEVKERCYLSSATNTRRIFEEYIFSFKKG